MCTHVQLCRSEEAKRKQSEQRKLQRKRSKKTDENATYGPPDKQQHFETENTTGHKKEKVSQRKHIPSRVYQKMDLINCLLLGLQ